MPPRKSLLLILFLSMALISQVTLLGCNTISGAGEDIEEAGDAIEDTINDEEDEL